MELSNLKWIYRTSYRTEIFFTEGRGDLFNYDSVLRKIEQRLSKDDFNADVGIVSDDGPKLFIIVTPEGYYKTDDALSCLRAYVHHRSKGRAELEFAGHEAKAIRKEF